MTSCQEEKKERVPFPHGKAPSLFSSCKVTTPRKKGGGPHIPSLLYRAF